jgi:hypothetical protein
MRYAAHTTYEIIYSDGMCVHVSCLDLCYCNTDFMIRPSLGGLVHFVYLKGKSITYSLPKLENLITTPSSLQNNKSK